MKTISLHQPWASLMALGLKTIETRHWPLPATITGYIAIHAAKKCVRFGKHDIITRSLRDKGLDYDDLPKGAILCYFEDVTCKKICNYFDFPEYPEVAFGDYSPGRYMWIMQRLHVLSQPFYIRGKQGIWNWTPEGMI